MKGCWISTGTIGGGTYQSLLMLRLDGLRYFSHGEGQRGKGRKLERINSPSTTNGSCNRRRQLDLQLRSVQNNLDHPPSLSRYVVCGRVRVCLGCEDGLVVAALCSFEVG